MAAQKKSVSAAVIFSHTFVKDSPPRQGSYKEMSGESKGVIG